MKRVILIGILFNAILSCEKNPDNSIVAVPLAPSNLAAVAVSTSKIDLTWTDNSTNESGFKIERKSGGDQFSRIANVGANVIMISDSGLSPSTTYSYRIYATNSAGNSVTYSNIANATTNAENSIPILTTIPLDSINKFTALSGGIISDTSLPITERGVVWSINTSPTIVLSTKTLEGSGAAKFKSHITGLSSNTIYYLRAYATNSVGTGYGNEVIFQTLDYSSVQIGGQVWMLRNLDVDKYQNGDAIPQVTDQNAWATLKTGAWCYYSNDPINGAIYGKLYNWYAVNDPRGLAPKGWSMPDQADWNNLITFLGGTNVAGDALRVVSGYWVAPNTGATNSSGFTALPGGMDSVTEGFPLAYFEDLNNRAKWWSTLSSTANDNYALAFDLYSSSSFVGFNFSYKEQGFSVRCIKK